MEPLVKNISTSPLIPSIKRLYRLLTAEQRKRLFRLQLLVAAMSFAELSSIAAIGGFMAVVGNMSILEGQGILASFYRLHGNGDPTTFLFWLGLGVLGVLTIAAIFSVLTTWKLSLYSQQVGAELSTRLYRHYMQQDWLFHAAGSSSDLTNKLAQECRRISDNVLSPLMQINAKIFLTFFISTAIFLFNPWVALSGLALFSFIYWVLYRTVRRRLIHNGSVVSKTNRLRFKLMNEGFGGIKDTLLLGRQSEFNRRFEKSSRQLGYAKGTNMALSQAPRYLMELVAFGAVITLVLYLLITHQGNLSTILPILSVYAMAGFKLMPAFQQIYRGLATVRGNIASFTNLQDDLEASQPENDQGESTLRDEKWVPHHSISLENITFRYPGKREITLEDINLTIPVNGVIGLVGASGCGKSTIIDLLLGLIVPEKGQVSLDGQPLTPDRRRAWQNTLGFVPQSIFLADASIRENIAFGLPREGIDDAKVLRAAKMAHLEELLERLPEGLDTRVGERGIQLSGGQRQRIGIARALYDDAEVLVMDEATSALDGITERLVIDAIHDFSGKKTIVMVAHRLATVKSCGRIYLLEAGRVIDSGTFDELVERNATFQRMAEHA
ncbi:ABC transporter ATP-binding protein [Halomonas stenophila]|uniref:HlyD family secretion protein n=1 Tax=Halomonas stenophila TaxID=795312 RepID=A0A7W5EQK9_9GAMM|nr:ABC transporter ATP-binding protein [Halomonas stenophila]MBB3229664.1 HlyD family secretion protein [Halomonas stenophila]